MTPNSALSAFTIPDEQAGLTKREYAAIHILAGLYANPECMDYTTLEGTAVAAADKLFAELEKPEP